LRHAFAGHGDRGRRCVVVTRPPPRSRQRSDRGGRTVVVSGRGERHLSARIIRHIRGCGTHRYGKQLTGRRG
jgi:hypothetical protein